MEDRNSVHTRLPDSDPVRKLRHDLRNTCNGIRLTIAVLERETDPIEMALCLEVIEHAADEAVELIDAFEAKHEFED